MGPHFPFDVAARSHPGVAAAVFSAMAENNVNVVETVSCYTDTIFIVSESDMISGYSILTKVIESAEQADGTEE